MDHDHRHPKIPPCARGHSWNVLRSTGTMDHWITGIMDHMDHPFPCSDSPKSPLSIPGVPMLLELCGAMPIPWDSAQHPLDEEPSLKSTPTLPWMRNLPLNPPQPLAGAVPAPGIRAVPQEPPPAPAARSHLSPMDPQELLSFSRWQQLRSPKCGW